MTRTHRSLHFSVFAMLGLALVVGCSKKNNNEITAENLVVAGNPATNRSIGDENLQFQVMGTGALNAGLKNGSIAAMGSKAANAMLQGHESNMLADAEVAADGEDAATTPTASALVLGFPIGLLGESQVFGGVVTKVSDKKSENLGRLKLADLTPIHSRAVVGKGPDGKYLFGIVGCFQSCTEGSDEPLLISLPALGVDTAKGVVLIDLAGLGKELNLIEMQDPQGSFTGLKTKSSETVAFDYSLSTLVFDIQTKMIPVTASETDPAAPETTFVVRWYLRLASVFDPAFKAREAAPGVGFFMSERTESPKVQRWAKPSVDGQVKYFIKNVPQEYRKTFAEAFDGWNVVFKQVLGKNLLSYEFLETTDPRYALVTAGDIRYNVLEWDLDNIAPYGGFGPSIANQFTGELLSANTLVQGPKIIEGYTKWYTIGEKANQLEEDGDIAGAEKLRRDATMQMKALSQKAEAVRFAMKLGKKLEFSIKSQEPGFDDPAFQRDDFELIPKGVAFADYMHGYFIDMVEHELGHNMGLRHNFRGNLSAKDTLVKGGVSHSVMEYLGRGTRHLDHIGEYDLMAIRWGYAGIVPDRVDMFCTDENVAAPNSPENSAECSRDDASNDPFKWFSERLDRVTALLTLPTTKEAPAWSVDDMDREVTSIVTGLGLYAFSADDTASSWSNFFKGGDRPTNAAGVKPYVLKQIKDRVCNPALDQLALVKGTPEAKAKTEQNLATLRNRMKSLLSPLKVYAETDLVCQ